MEGEKGSGGAGASLAEERSDGFSLKRMLTSGSSFRSRTSSNQRKSSETNSVSSSMTDVDEVPGDEWAPMYESRQTSFFKINRKKTTTPRELPKVPKREPALSVPTVDLIGHPSIFITPYGTDWALDIIALPQNAIRSELDDLYTLLVAIAAKGQHAKVVDFERLVQWMTMFRSFVEKYLNIQEMLVFPWVEKNARPLYGQLSRQKRAEARNRILTHLQKIYDIPKTGIQRMPGSALHTLCPDLRRGVDGLATTLTAYFGEIESQLPRLLKEHYDPAQVKNMHRGLIDAFSTTPYKKEHIVLLAWWMTQQPQKGLYKAWKSENIRGTRAVGFSEWEGLFSKNHSSIVYKSQNVVYKS